MFICFADGTSRQRGPNQSMLQFYELLRNRIHTFYKIPHKPVTRDQQRAMPKINKQFLRSVLAASALVWLWFRRRRRAGNISVVCKEQNKWFWLLDSRLHFFSLLLFEVRSGTWFRAGRDEWNVGQKTINGWLRLLFSLFVGVVVVGARKGLCLTSPEKRLWKMCLGVSSLVAWFWYFLCTLEMVINWCFGRSAMEPMIHWWRMWTAQRTDCSFRGKVVQFIRGRIRLLSHL